MIGEVLWGPPGRRTPLDTPVLEVPIPDLPEPLVGFRLGVISDLHFGLFVQETFALRVIDAINDLHPDAVVLPGDTIDDREWRARRGAQLLGGLRSRHGSFAVLGNHDYYAGPRTVAQEFRRAGIMLLNNRGRRIEHDGASLWLAGVDDYSQGRPDIAAALIGRRPDEPAVLLAHNPDTVEMIEPDHRIGLQVSGHTHGGQIAPFGVPIVTRIARRKHTRGLTRHDHGWVYTSTGAGLCGIALRINTRPEAPLLRLVRA